MPSVSLAGTPGADLYAFAYPDDIGLAFGDRIILTAFQQGLDLIDLAPMDALTGFAGNQQFTFIGTAAHTGLGATLRYDKTATSTLIFGDVDADGLGDFALELTGTFDLTVADFTDLSIDRVLGTGAADVMTGSDGAEVFYGLAGADTIDGRDGDDLIFGGAGWDDINGGAGNDTAVGGDGMDTLRGWLGNDLLQGMASNDWLAGGDGNDTIQGGLGDDTAYGNADDDLLEGGAGHDSLDGGDGNDTVDGGTGSDSMRGGRGDDLLLGRSGADTMYGGDGDDTLEGHDGNDSMDGGAGDDSLNGGADDDTLRGGEGSDTLQGYIGNDSLDGGAWHDWLAGGDGDDTADGGTGNDTVYGNRGDDLVRGGAGQDELDGGDGADTVLGGTGADTLRGGLGNDLIDGEAGHDIADGGDGNDTIYGGDGNDMLEGGAGRDDINGGAGNDTVSGGDGADTLRGYLGNDVLNGGLSADWIAGGDGADTINGGLGNDTVYGNEGNDSIDGGAGYDLLDGGDGDDTVNGGDGGDSIRGGLGMDLLRGAAGSDTISGGDGNDTIEGGHGANLMSGDRGDDVIRSLGSADTAIGGAGIDVLELNQTFDTYSMVATALPLGYLLTDGNGNTVDSSEIEIIRFRDGYELDLRIADNAAYAADDVFSTDEETPLVITAAQLLANDVDFEGDGFFIASVTGTSWPGQVVWSDNGTQVTDVTFTPGYLFSDLALGETRSTTFTYTIQDDTGRTSTATVEVEVEGVNDAPGLRFGAIVPVFSPLIPGGTFAGLSGNLLADPDGDPLVFSVEDLMPGLILDPLTGAITGTPDPDAERRVYDTILTAVDPYGLEYSIQFNLNYADIAPTAVDDTYIMNAATSLTVDVSFNDDLFEAPNGAPQATYVYTLPDRTLAGPSYGEVEITQDGIVTYTPDPGVYGSDEFIYTVTADDGTTSEGRVHVDILDNTVSERPATVDAGVLGVADFAYDANNEVSGVIFRIPRTLLTQGVTGDPDDIENNLQLVLPNGFSAAGDGPIAVLDGSADFWMPTIPDTRAYLTDDALEIVVSPEQLTGERSMTVRIGYQNLIEVQGVAIKEGESPAILIYPDPTRGLDTAQVRWTTATTIIDDRYLADGELIIGGALVNGGDGDNGILSLTTPIYEASDFQLVDGSDFSDGISEVFAPYILEFANSLIQSLDTSFTYLYNNFTEPFVNYARTHGQDGLDGQPTMNQGVSGGTTDDVILGRSQTDAARGGDGGDATKGGDGWSVALNPYTIVALIENFAGADGGDGGDGGSSDYFIYGGDGQDTITGGNGGDGGAGGHNGYGSVAGLRSDVSFGERADGGPAGTRGLGGAGGDAEYWIHGQDGADVIYGGNGGNGGSTGRNSLMWAAGGDSSYFIEGGAGNDEIFGGTAGYGGDGAGGGDALYRIHGGADHDTIHVGAFNMLNENSTVGVGNIKHPSEISHINWANRNVTVGYGNDTTTFFSDIDLANFLMPGERYGTSRYEVFGGNGADTIIYDGTLSRHHYTDGGNGQDTMRVIRPDPYLSTEWSLDLTAGGFSYGDGTPVPARRDTIDQIEDFEFVAPGGPMTVVIDGASAAAIAEGSLFSAVNPVTSVGLDQLIMMRGEGNVTLDFDGSDGWGLYGTIEFGGTVYDDYYNAVHNVHILEAGMTVIF